MRNAILRPVRATGVALTQVMTRIRTINWTNRSRGAQNRVVDGSFIAA